MWVQSIIQSDVWLTKTAKPMLWSVQQLVPNGLDVENYWISNDYDYNGIRSRVVSKHELNLLEHFDCVMDAVANHLQLLDYVDDANRTYENFKRVQQYAHERNTKKSKVQKGEKYHTGVISHLSSYIERLLSWKLPWMRSTGCCIAWRSMISTITIVPRHRCLKCERKAFVQASVTIFNWHAVNTVIWVTASIHSVLMLVGRCEIHTMPKWRASVR